MKNELILRGGKNISYVRAVMKCEDQCDGRLMTGRPALLFLGKKREKKILPLTFPKTFDILQFSGLSEDPKNVPCLCM